MLAEIVVGGVGFRQTLAGNNSARNLDHFGKFCPTSYVFIRGWEWGVAEEEQ